MRKYDRGFDRNIKVFSTADLGRSWLAWDEQHTYACTQLGINAQVDAISNKIDIEREIDRRYWGRCSG